MRLLLVHLFLHLSFFVIGAYATTDILRLTVKGTVSVADPVCRCPICNSRIPLRDQIPLISYILRGGKCRFCGSRIPITEPLAEFLIIAGLSLIAVLTGYRPVGFPICLLFYGFCKATALLVIGVRKEGFVRSLFTSLLLNVFVFALMGLIYFFCYLAALK